MASRGDIEAGKAHVTVYARSAPLITALDDIKDRMTSFGASFMKAGAAIGGVGVAILSPLAAAVTQFVSAGAELEKLSQRSGIAASSLAEMKFAAEQTGNSLADVENASKQITKTLADATMGSAGAHLALSRLGLAAEELKTKTPEKQLEIVAERIAAIKDPALQAAMAAQLLGNANLAPLARNLAGLRREARDLNLVPTDKAVADAGNLSRAVQKVFAVMRASVFEIGAALAPLLIPAAETIARIASAVTGWIRQNQLLVRVIAAIGVGVVALGAAIAGVGAVVYGVGLAFGALAAAGAALVGGGLVPMIAAGVAIGAAIGGATYAWLRFTATGRATAAWLGELFGRLAGTMKTTLGGIGDALRAGDLQLAAQIAVKGIQLAFMQGVDAITALIGGQLGDTFGTIASQLIQGDFLGAWQTALKQLAAWHAQISEGITAIWTAGARVVVEAWQKTVNTISDKLLDTSAQGGIAGKIASAILGVDVQEEIARGKDLDRRAGIDGPDQLEEAKRNARAQTDAVAADLQKRLDAIDLRAQAKTDAAGQKLAAATAGGASGLPAEIAKLQAELAALRKQAKTAADNAAGNLAGGGIPGGPDVVNPAALRQGFGTFSAAALLAGGNDGGAAAKMERLAREQKRIAEEQRDEAQKAVKELGKVVEWGRELVKNLTMK